jgi:class 3 adenylate cyclase
VGDSFGAHQALDEWEREDPRSVSRCRELVDALSATPAGRGGEPVALVPAGAPVDLTMLAVAATDVELADALDRPEIAANAVPILTEGYDRGMRFTAGWSLFIPRLAGVAYMLAGRHTEANEWLERARADARSSGAVGEAARVAYDTARLRLAAGDAAGASESLETAIDELERVGYGPLLTAARRLAGRPDIHEAPAPTAPRVILVTDLVDSTPLNQRVGDRRFVELLREHNRIVRGRLRQLDGVEFKQTGDGIAAWFLTAGAAVRCALGIQEDLEEYNRSRDEPLRVRIGLASGEVIISEGDLFGLAVIEAFRVSDHATDGRILVSETIPALIRDPSIHFRSVGEVSLKGFADSRSLYEVVEAAREGTRT